MTLPPRGKPAFRNFVFAAACAVLGTAAAGDDATFERWWRDGRAELDGYRLEVGRYGESRKGRAVMIFVTEPFSESRRVKVEDPSRDPKDAVDVLKLNLVRDFQTGIYDYHTMLSVFVRTADFSPLKVSFASGEWCGNLYEEMRIDRGRIAQQVSSYFDRESRGAVLARPAAALLEDELPVWVRGLRHDPLRRGERREVPFLPGAFFRRLTHRPAAWTKAVVERSAGDEAIAVPAGRYVCSLYSVRVAGGRVGRFWVEAPYPHRIVKWSWSQAGAGAPPGLADGGELLGSARLAYWKLHANGDESYLRELGLSPLAR